MVKVPTIVPISELREGAASLLRRLRETREPIVITQRGRATAVLQSVEAYEQAEEERRILEALARGDREIDAGQGTDLDTVLGEADKLLGGN